MNPLRSRKPLGARIAALCAGLAAGAALVGAAPAMAAVTHTAITTPGDPYHAVANQANATELRVVSGTSDGTTGDLVDLRCYANGTDWSPNPGQDIPVNADGSFSGQINLFSISDNGSACILRAVPDNTYPGNTSAFSGPRMLITYWQGPESSSPYNVHNGGTVTPYFYGEFEGLKGNSYLLTVNANGLYRFAPTNPTTLYNNGYWQHYYPVEDGAALYQGNQDGKASSVRIDGTNAYTVGALPYMDYDGAGPEGYTYPAGVASPQASISQDGNGNVTVTESEPLYFCQDTSYPPNSTKCPTVTSAGVRLDRTLASSDSGQTFTVTDNLVSTDGAQHTVGANYYNRADNYYNYIEFRMPGEANASVRNWGDMFRWQSAPATMFWFDTGDESTSGAGALTELQKPDSTTWGNSRRFYQNYDSTTVPAGGSASLAHIYQVAFLKSEIEAAAGAKTDPFGAPQVAVTSPSDGTLTKAESVVVTGTASDNVGVKSLKVNGTPTLMNQDGTWSATVPLTEGTNTITAVAADGAGQSTQASVRVIRGPGACRVPTLVGGTKAQAVAALQAAGCGVGKEKSVFSGSVKAGNVAAQGAGPGALLALGTGVDYAVSKGAFPSPRVAKTKVRLKGNSVIISVKCAATGAATNGTIKLRKTSGKHQTLGTRAFQCPSGKARNVAFAVSTATAAGLRRTKSTKVYAFIVSRGPDGAAASRRTRITIVP
jgi:hypothetical protein